MGVLECVLEQPVGAFDDNRMTARRLMTNARIRHRSVIRHPIW
jgi:hypothetical protein